jgi:sulfatase maturation enzyme AslB (radical SAM superfamily)
MGAMAITAFLNAGNLPPDGIVVTAVLPGGCPLKCSFCFVDLREERNLEFNLTSEHLPALMKEIRREGKLGGGAIVGDEPLQDHVWPYTKAFLDYTDEANVPSALITNGYNLEQYADRLKSYRQLKVMVSLDGVGDDHDRIRSTAGSFARLDAGLTRLMAWRGSSTVEVKLATTLMPRNAGKIRNIIEYAARKGVGGVLVSPLLHKNAAGKLVPHSSILSLAPSVCADLVQIANSHGVALKFADEFGLLPEWDDALLKAGVTVASPKTMPSLLRVDAFGKVETLASIKNGTSAGLQLPSSLGDIQDFTSRILELFQKKLPGNSIPRYENCSA